jgi:hypothetical protein
MQRKLKFINNNTMSLKRLTWHLGIATLALAGAVVAADQTIPPDQPSGSPVAREVLDSSFQTELPRPSPPSPLPTVVPMILPSQLLAVVWVVAGLLALVWLARTVVLPRVLHEDQNLNAVAPADLPPDDLPLPDHAALAASRKFAEAIHVLLLGALALTARRLRTSLADSWTGREALGRLALPADQREDLRLLLNQAEVCHFGAREADAGTYQACLASYERLRGAAT